MPDPTPPDATATNPHGDRSVAASLSVASDRDETAASPAQPAQQLPTFGPPAAEGEVGMLGPYRVVKELGKGGMGAVYLAYDVRLKRKIAMKVMLPEFAADKVAKERFLREAQAAAQITHDNVVTVYEADERDGTPYIAMQFLNGLPLNEYLKQKPRLSVAQILRITREAAMGLSAAHKIGLVHRDIKPANLWLEAPSGRVKVLDFGLARPIGTDSELTRSGAVVGTPAYMSPEQARGVKVDHRTDLFSLGAVMYRLCTGESPFQGPTMMSVLMALGTEEPTQVRERNPVIPAPVAALVHQLLSKKPELRPQTADEVVKRIRAIAEELTATAQNLPASLPQAVVVVPAAHVPENNAFADLGGSESDSESSAEVDAPKPIRKKSRKVAWIGAGFAGLLAVVVAAVVIIIKNKDGTETRIEFPDGASVTVKDKAGKTIAQVSPGGKPPVVVAADADRKAAEWVFSIGGSVKIISENRYFKAAAELPKNPFSLTAVYLGHNKAVTDAGLAHFKDCKNLTTLEFVGTNVTDTGLAHLKDCKNLTHLNLNGTQVTGTGLVHLKDCINLTHLYLSAPQMTDTGLAHLKNYSNLRDLVLDSTQVTDTGMTHFKECKNLTVLYLNDTKVSDAGLAHLKDCKNLNGLNLSNTQVTDAGLAHLKECKNLKSLYVGGTKVTAKGVEEFHAAVSGCRIEHDGGIIEPKAVAADSDRKGAEWVISIGGHVRINGEERDIKAAAELPKAPFSLTVVYIQGNKSLTDAGLADLKDCKNLTYLNLMSTQVTDAGLVHFKECKNLTSLLLGDNTKISDEGLAFFKDCKNLKVLNLSYMVVTDKGLAHFKDCKELTNLYLYGPGVTDEGLAFFKDCKNLIDLSLYRSQVTDASLAQIKVCKNLSRLDLSSKKVSDAALANLKDCENLSFLNLESTQVTDAGLTHLKECKNLKQLGLHSTQVTDAGLAHLKDCKSLNELNVKGTKVTAKGLEEFHSAVLGCRIEHDGGIIEPKGK